MRADCILDAYPDKVWKGTVQQVSPVARGEGREATRRFFDVLVKLDQAAPRFMRPGMSMRVEVVRRRVEGALLVPRAAVRGVARQDRGATARTARRRTVEIDWCTELACVLRGGAPCRPAPPCGRPPEPRSQGGLLIRSEPGVAASPDWPVTVLAVPVGLTVLAGLSAQLIGCGAGHRRAGGW